MILPAIVQCMGCRLCCTGLWLVLSLTLQQHSSKSYPRSICLHCKWTGEIWTLLQRLIKQTILQVNKSNNTLRSLFYLYKASFTGQVTQNSWHGREIGDETAVPTSQTQEWFYLPLGCWMRIGRASILLTWGQIIPPRWRNPGTKPLSWQCDICMR